MKKTSKRGWILSLLTGVAAAVVLIRRRMQPIDSQPLLPMPPLPPAEPPRIVLPSEILNTADSVPEASAPTPVETTMTSEAEQVAAVVAETSDASGATQTEASPQEMEAPLLERAVGGVAVTAPSQPEAVADESTADDDDNTMTGYCVSCRTKRTMVDAHEETTENGRRALRGTCEVCGSNMFRFLPNQP